MNKDILINLVISQVGKEKAQEVLSMLLGLADKMSSDDIYIIKKLGNKGVCLIGTNGKDCKINFSGEAEPKITELENTLRDIEI